jgi:hypothetical protein
MSAPARPRPRPRPRAKPSGSSDAIPVGATNSPDHTTSKTIIPVNQEILTASSKAVDALSAAEEVADDDFDIFAKRRNAYRAVRPVTEEIAGM